MPVVFVLACIACGSGSRWEGLVEVTPVTLWQHYQRQYISPAGYAQDPQRQGRVSSEAQSYALLQAAWLHDRESFERIWTWTDRTLRRSDGLFSWLWDPADGGRISDANTATDGDTDIAYALILASRAFDKPEYLDRARDIVRAIRASASIPIGNDWLPSAGNWAGAERVVNLSYFAPYAYAAFDEIDPDAGWPRAIDIGYQLLQRLTEGTPARLPPDFVSLTADGQPTTAPDAFSRDFSFDSVRIAWRIDLDCRLRHEPRACAVQPLVGRLRDLWLRDGRLVTRYNVAGEPLADAASLSFYGAVLPAFARHHPEVAQTWRATVLSPAALHTMMASSDRYYDANWVWFGLAATDGQIDRSSRP